MTRADARARAQWWQQSCPGTDCPFPPDLVLALLDEATRMTTKAITGYRIKDGKLVKRPPRMAPVLARGQKHKADRIEKRLRENAAKSKGDTT